MHLKYQYLVPLSYTGIAITLSTMTSEGHMAVSSLHWTDWVLILWFTYSISKGCIYFWKVSSLFSKFCQHYFFVEYMLNLFLLFDKLSWNDFKGVNLPCFLVSCLNDFSLMTFTNDSSDFIICQSVLLYSWFFCPLWRAFFFVLKSGISVFNRRAAKILSWSRGCLTTKWTSVWLLQRVFIFANNLYVIVVSIATSSNVHVAVLQIAILDYQIFQDKLRLTFLSAQCTSGISEWVLLFAAPASTSRVDFLVAVGESAFVSVWLLWL